MSDQIAVLQRIAAFAAKVRGHALGKWRTEGGFAVASCIQCGRQLTVYRSAIEPEMDGDALACECEAAVRASAA
jgi:hypothetical protein